MFCGNCGTSNADDARFCANCGAPLTQPQPAPQPAPRAVAQPTPEPAPQPTPEPAPQPMPQSAPQTTPDYQNPYTQPGAQPPYTQPGTQPAYGQPAPQPTYGQPGTPQPVKKKNKALPWIIVGAAVIVVAAIVVTLILVLGGGGNATSKPENAALSFFEGTVKGDYKKAVSAVHPAMMEEVDKEEFEQAAAMLKGFGVKCKNIKVEEVEHYPEECEDVEDSLLYDYDLDVTVNDVCCITISYDITAMGEEESSELDMYVFLIDKDWFVYPDY